MLAIVIMVVCRYFKRIYAIYLTVQCTFFFFNHCYSNNVFVHPRVHKKHYYNLFLLQACNKNKLREMYVCIYSHSVKSKG